MRHLFMAVRGRPKSRTGNNSAPTYGCRARHNSNRDFMIGHAVSTLMSVSLPFFVPLFSVYLFRHLSQFRTSHVKPSIQTWCYFNLYPLSLWLPCLFYGSVWVQRRALPMEYALLFSYRRFILYWPFKYRGYISKAL